MMICYLHLRLETEIFMKEKGEVVALNVVRSGFGTSHGQLLQNRQTVCRTCRL
jgi:hypothetical protein